MDKNKRYEAMKLFVQQSQQKKMQQTQKKLQQTQKKLQAQQEKLQKSAQKNVDGQISLQDDLYYEIEYDATPMPGVGKYVLKSQSLQTPERDEVRELFDRMREIARRNRIQVYGSSKFYNKKVQQERTEIFYKQGQFMKDFQDEFEEVVPYSEYFPCYQMMGYKQLRTYFTWRTKVRHGQVEDTSLSYAYLYLYELINNIGVSDPQDGLEKLLDFWKAFRVYQPAVDKHVPKWLKDYHIYYGLEQSFHEFVAENEMTEWYPELAEANDIFVLYCGLSKYDVRKSKFYSEDRETLIQDCFRFTLQRLSEVMEQRNLNFEELIFAKPKALALWMPFQDALFYPWMAQEARRIVISPKEVYVCSQSQWYYQVSMVLDGGRQLLGYIVKQMEAVLRQTVKYKYKITADVSVVPSTVICQLQAAGISLERCIAEAVAEFYREATKTVVTVDREALEKIRRESLQTQEKLLVPEEDGPEMGAVQMSLFQTPPATVVVGSELAALEQSVASLRPSFEQESALLTSSEQAISAIHSSAEKALEPSDSLDSLDILDSLDSLDSIAPSNPSDPWRELRAALSQTQLEALRLALAGDASMKEFADAHGIMLEVLADGINEKAVDTVGDSLLDEEFMVYDDYVEQVRDILGQ